MEGLAEVASTPVSSFREPPDLHGIADPLLARRYERRFDVCRLIRDGTGAPAFAGDVGIKGEGIVAVGGKSGPARLVRAAR